MAQRRKGDTFITYGDGFSSGVASGDPLPGKIILWTRFQIPGDQSQKSAGDPTNAEYTHNYSPGEGVKPVTVHWFLGPNANGMGAINAGTFYTSGARDWTVKVDADYSKGAVKAQTKLYYGFHATYGKVSPRGDDLTNYPRRF